MAWRKAVFPLGAPQWTIAVGLQGGELVPAIMKIDDGML